MVKSVPLASIQTIGYSAYARLAIWKTTYGSELNFEWRGATFPAKITKYDGEMRLMYRQSKQYTHYVPFALELTPYDPDMVHIHNIHKVNGISGTQMVNFVLALCRKLGASEALLQDEAMVVCKKNNHAMTLSLITLLKSGKSFYERFGFVAFPKTKRLRMAALLRRLRKVQMVDVLKRFEQAVDMLEKARADPRTFDLVTKGIAGYPDVYMRDPVKEIPSKLGQFKRIVSKLKKSKTTLLVDFLAYSAQHQTDCAVYTDFLQLAFDEHRIAYQGKELVVNVWSNTLERIQYESPRQLKYIFKKTLNTLHV
jgi:hypothetical protein